jgi:large subunit ribosomal protein L30e
MQNRKRKKLDLSRKKKEKEYDIDLNIRVALNTGKVTYGKNQVLRELRQNPHKMLIISRNCPQSLEDKLNHYNSLLDDKEKVFIHKYKGSSWDLGLACAKPYMISILGIYDAGDSELMELKSKS